MQISERWVFQRWDWRVHRIKIGLTLIERVIPAVKLIAVVILEVVIEGFQELIECNHGFIGHLGEDERATILIHVSESHWHGVEFEFPAGRTPADRVFHRAQ
jgi:hypothetical protein